MSALLQIENFGSGNLRQQSMLAADYTSGTTITPKNTDGMATQLMLLVGRPGDELTELGQIQSVSSPNVTLVAGLSYAHAKYAQITVLAADQIKIYRTPNVDGTVPTDATFIASGVLATISIQPDSLTTLYDDQTGGDSYWYKFVYSNSLSGATSAIADSIAMRGGVAGYYTSVYAIRQEAGMLQNRFVSDVDIAAYRTRAQSVVDSTISNRYTVPLTTPVSYTIDRATAVLAAGYALLTDYGALAQGSSKDGQAKVDQAMKMLSDIQTGVSEIFDSKGQALMQTQVGGWPDDTTASQPEYDDTGNPQAGGGSIFNISHKF